MSWFFWTLLFLCIAGFLPAWWVYIHWHRGKTEKGQSLEYFKIFEKENAIFNEHPVYKFSLSFKIIIRLCCKGEAWEGGERDVEGRQPGHPSGQRPSGSKCQPAYMGCPGKKCAFSSSFQILCLSPNPATPAMVCQWSFARSQQTANDCTIVHDIAFRERCLRLLRKTYFLEHSVSQKNPNEIFNLLSTTTAEI